jgi:hypothetical protein
VVQALDFAELERVDDEADVTIAGKPRAVVLIRHLVAVAHAVTDDGPVAAHVKHRWRRLRRVLRQVQIGCDVKARERLEVEVLDGEVFMLQTSRCGGLEVGARGQRVEAEHLREFRAQLRRTRLPGGRVRYVTEATLRQFARAPLEVARE